MNNMKCAITGASGYVGSNIAKYLRKRGFDIYEMGRKHTLALNGFFIPYQLGAENDYSKLKEVDVLIHCAHDFNTSDEKNNVNITGSASLFENARKQGVKQIIFISSLSAFPNVKSKYGQTKLRIEDISKKWDVITIRPGLIFSKNMQGIFGAMKKFVKKFPVVPLIGLGNQIFHPCHVDDLSQLIMYLMQNNIVCRIPIVAASSHSVTFKEIVETLAAASNKKILLLPLPYDLLYWGMLTLEKLHIKIGLRSDSLVSVKDCTAAVDFSLIDSFKLSFRELNVSTLNEEDSAFL